MKKILFIGLCLCFSSCGLITYGPVFVDFVNQTSAPVQLSYSTQNWDIHHNSFYYDTISYEIDPNSNLELPFKATYNNSRKKLSKCIPFFKFETSTKSVRFEGPEEVIRIFHPKDKSDDFCEFIITDSLFSRK